MTDSRGGPPLAESAPVPDFRPELAVAVAAAVAAGALLLNEFRRPSTQRRKGRHDVVTALDRSAEGMIMSRLAEAFPRDARLGEETGASGNRRRGGSGRTWIVDPLDGTINYAAGLPIWCVSVALAAGPDVALGVIHDAVHDDTFAAIRGAGAWHVGDDTRLRIRHLRRRADAVVAADPGAEDDLAADLRIRELRPAVRSIRVPGSTAWSLVALASGRLDGVLQVRGLQAVDVAAAGLIACEAGARVTASDGGPWFDLSDPARGRGIAAAGRGVHQLLVRPLRGQSPACSSK